MLTVAVGAGEDSCETMDSHLSTLGVSNKYLLTEKALFDFDDDDDDDRGLRFEDIVCRSLRFSEKQKCGKEREEILQKSRLLI